MAPINVVFSGATGSVGRSVVPGILRHPDFKLVGAVGRRRAGDDIGTIMGLEPAGVRLTTDIQEALDGTDAHVLIDYSSPSVATGYCRAAVERGVAVIMATTALDPREVEEIGQIAERNGVGAFLAPNLTVVGQIMFRLVEVVKRYMGDVEIVEGHPPTKLDSPSGTSRETAERINDTPGPAQTTDLTRLGMPESRGAQVGHVRIHSLRMTGLIDHQEVIFSQASSLLSIRTEVFSSDAFIEPTLKAARLVLKERGLIRELPGLFDPEY